MGRPKEHDEQTRERLLRAAAAILHAEGVGALSARRLAGEIDVSTRAIYSLFDGMDGVLTELFRRGAAELARRHDEVPRLADAAQEIVPLALAYRGAALASPEMYGLMLERAAPAFCPTPELLELAWHGGIRVRETVARAMAQRGLDEGDPDMLAMQLWTVVHGHASLEIKGLLGEPAFCEAALCRTISALVAQFLPGDPLTAGAGG